MAEIVSQTICLSVWRSVTYRLRCHESKYSISVSTHVYPIMRIYIVRIRGVHGGHGEVKLDLERP